MEINLSETGKIITELEPDNINIIDWTQLGDNFYRIGMIIDGIQSKLRNGIAGEDDSPGVLV